VSLLRDFGGLFESRTCGEKKSRRGPKPKSLRRGNRNEMRKSLTKSVLMSAALLLGSCLTALAQSATPPCDACQDRRDIRHDTRDIRSDRRDVRGDVRERREDARDLREDRREGASRQELREDRREVTRDTRDIRGDRRDLHADRRDRRADFRDVRHDRRGH
jgi:hypothetical protein